MMVSDDRGFDPDAQRRYREVTIHVSDNRRDDVVVTSIMPRTSLRVRRIGLDGLFGTWGSGSFEDAAGGFWCAYRLSSRVRTDLPGSLIKHGNPLPAGTRFAVQFNNDPAIVLIADGRGGPPILYRGRELNPDHLKSIIILRTKEARERFRNQTIDAAILIELK
ncbi:MAG TPA: hypothetical protein VNO75_04695 [Gemmatimonadaceae bacterium]|nr:hypothetical protein [Gemmatimonadaceae bacterium]